MTEARSVKRAAPVRATKEGILIKLRVSPGAKRTAVKGAYGEEAMKLSVAAPPVDGKANAEISRFLAGLLAVARSDVEIVGGVSGRDKTVFVRGPGGSETLRRLSHHL